MERDRPILLLGASGQVGHELQRTLKPLGEIVAPTHGGADLAAPESLRPLIRAARPCVIMNAAAYTAVDKAESEPEIAEAVNARSPGVLAEEADTLGAVLVHYSTDYVFDGRKTGAYCETDETDPQSVYGRSKLAGEHAIRSACCRHLILRTSWVFAARGANFLKTILRLAGERDNLHVVTDQYGAPTSAALIAEMTALALNYLGAAPQTDLRWGLYHLTAAGETSWHGYARYVIEGARKRGVPLKAGQDAITPITTTDYPTPAKRPANSRLDTAKFRSTFAVTLPDWRSGVDEVLDRLMIGTGP